MNKRNPKKRELDLIRFLIKSSYMDFSEDLLKSIKVSPMNDSGMGGLTLFTENFKNEQRVFGDCIADYTFKDQDNVEVIVSLYVDSDGDLFELDIWKVDFSPLICLPIV